MDSGEGASGRLRTPTDRQEYRRAQYKSGSGSSSTPEWKSKYRQRCMDRLKHSRERLVSRFRQMEVDSPPSTSTAPEGVASQACSGEGVDQVVVSVKEVMEEEWEIMRTENANLPQLTPHRPCRKRAAPSSLMESMDLGSCKRQQQCSMMIDSEEEYEESEDIDYILSIIDDLTRELIHEEQAMLAQCRERQIEMDLRFYEECSLDAMRSNDQVVCPVCQKNILLQDVRSIYCSCGLQINTIHDGLSLNFLKDQLETCVTQHSALCGGKPVFSLDCNLGIQNLIMNCASCDFMYIIL